MENLLNWKDPLFVGLWQSSWQASVLIGVVLLLHWFLGKKLSPGWRYSLWLLVLARLALPFTPASPWSVFNVAAFDSLRSSSSSAHSFEDPTTTPAVYPLAKDQPERIAASPNAQSDVSIANLTTQTRLDSRLSAVAKAFLVWLPTVWIWGVLLQIIRICWQNVRFANRMKDRFPITNPELLELLEECKSVMKVRLQISLFETPLVRSPALYGLFRPRLLLPENLIESFSRQEVRHVLWHELAHVKRSDMVVNWLMTVLRTFHWFNPFVWFAFSRMRADREMACDALALASANEKDTTSYGATIIKLLEAYARPARSPSLMGILEEKTQMQRRIRMIAHFRKPSRWSAWAVLLLVGLGWVGLTDARIPEPTSPTPVQNTAVTVTPKIVPASVQVRGRVIDGATSQPIDAFKIFIRRKQGVTNGAEYIHYDAIIPAGGGTNGEFSVIVGDKPIGYDIEIRADGYATKRLGWLGLEDGDQSLICLLAKSVPIEGILRLADGQPAKGVEVALWTDAIPIVFDQTGFLNRRSSHIARTDAEGRFAFKPESDALRIIAVDDKGYAEGKIDPSLTLQRLTLQPWGRVEGSLLVGRKAGKGEKVGLMRKGLRMFPYTVTTDDSGEFIFERVPPGEFTLSRVANGTFFSGNTVRVRSSETTHAMLGGTGRMVVGRLTWTTSGRKIDWKSKNVETRFYSKTLPPPGNYPVSLQSDGSFAIEDVPPGIYQLAVTVRETQAAGTAPFVLPHQNDAAPSQSATTNVQTASAPILVSGFPVGKLVAALEKAVEVRATIQNDGYAPLDIGTLEIKALPSSLTSRF